MGRPVTSSTVVDLYAGAGGWDAAARWLGLDPIGIELDPDACATRRAARLATIRADLHDYEPPATPLDGIIASPPCRIFSQAGSRAGTEALPDFIATLDELDWCGWPDHGYPADTELLWRVYDWWDRCRPRWVACEQVRPVLPFWQAMADRLRTAGWHAWTGIVDAADYGVPRNRERAILLAHRDRPVGRPEPTHDRDPHPVLFGQARKPWVSMADALGWDGMLDQREGSPNRVRPMVRTAPTLTTSAVDRNWCWDRPATTVTTDARVWPPGHKLNRDDIDRLGQVEAERRYGGRSGTDAVRVTPAEAAALQSFPPDWPWQGSRTAQARQIGNAVPPLLAWHLLRTVTSDAQRPPLHLPPLGDSGDRIGGGR